MYVKPAPDRTVPDPELGGNLRPQGRNVPQTQYWLRRVEEQDVVLAEPPEEPAPSAE